MKLTRPIEQELIDNRSAVARETSDVAQLQLLAKLMDSVFEIPGLRLRFGLDAILGLLPGFGDLATSLVSLYILREAHRRGVSRLTLTRMAFNILVDWLIGSIPLAGDAFDVYWKSNQRNVELLLQHEVTQAPGLRKIIGDWFFLVLLITILVTVLAGSLIITFFIVSSLTRWLFQN